MTAHRKIGVGDVVITPKARENVLHALDHHRLTYGPWSKELERRFAQVHRRRFACFVNSGTDALRLGLAALKERYGWKSGDSVLVPALTFVASVNVILQNGLNPVLVDIEPDYYSMDLQKIGSTAGVVGMMPVHLFGQAADPRLHSFAGLEDLRVIADSCETMFVDGCAEGEVSCFSTFACHVMQTGVGGFATTNDPDLAMLIRSYANHGRNGIYTGIDDALGNKETIAARFHFERSGYSSRATEMEAAIGCAELDDWQANLARRNHNAALLTAGLTGLPLDLPKIRPGGEHSWMMYPLRARDQATRDALVLHLEQRGIETRPLQPLTNQPVYRALWGEDLEERFPVAQMVNRTGFFVGCHPNVSDADVEYMVRSFAEFFD